ncbi:hypothetical protein Glove_174g43 [Diversispora epigaea]|uniref:Uncharacterized protein n=1 Tax=Diversispora epigaea TaxID=1348612 RepID=A0A397IVB2_9GLOM|nr:hypothetical protein Glove_174g43 [Diversispora epigaea]
MSRFFVSIFLNFLFGKIVQSLPVPLALEKASIVDESYTSYQDVFDALLNALFPITFIILFNVSKTGPIKRVLLPLFDDILYNAIAWVFPLIVSLSYEMYPFFMYLLFVAIFHIVHSVLAIKKKEIIDDLHTSETEVFNNLTISLISNPAIFIPEIWIVNISYRLAAGYFNPMMITFLVLFSILLICSVSFRIKIQLQGWPKKRLGIYTVYSLIFFYTPTILQTLYITIYLPVNFYFVKSLIFVLVICLTRGVSYFYDRIPGDFLATSYATVHYYLRTLIDKQYRQ